VADAVLGRDALTSVLAKPATLLQGTLGIILFSAVAMVVLGGDVAIPILNIGIGSIVLLILCLGAMWLSAGYERRHVWTVVEEPEEEPDGDEDEEAHTPVRKLIVRTVIVGFVILVSGFLLAQTGDAIAEQSGIGASFVGLILVGFATSLPELSTVVAALKRQRYEMAVGDIFGTNLFNIALIFMADAAFRGGPILRLAGPFEAVAAVIALALTGIFIIGLLERRDRTVFRMGYDSLAAIVVFAGGMLVLYRIAPAG
jgi:cation:H+ antiporter